MIDSSFKNFSICSSCSLRSFSGALCLFGSLIFFCKFSLKVRISLSFLSSLSISFSIFIWTPSSKKILVVPKFDIPHPLGKFSQFSIILILEHLPRVAKRSVCSFMICQFVIIKLVGLMFGGRFTLEAMDLRHPAILFTFSNSFSICLKCSAEPSYRVSKGVGKGAMVMLLALPGKLGNFWQSSSLMKGIIGCNALSPFSMQVNKVRAVFSLSSWLPAIKTGLVASRQTSQSSQSQKLQKALAASPRLYFSKLLLMSTRALFNFPRIQLLRKFCLIGLSSLLKSLIRSIFGFVNLKVCQILLQNCLYDTILLTFRLMLLLCTIYERSPNLKASEPHSGIP